ncbi:Thermophilic serine proteinase precursor [Stieleria maiorica]|uniref:Thermophilic serine proteinase n=1 Tax=Stieleria maiorica TaxID=2795974 RepID=A0A5B9M7X9_9BACT|nr:S8 family serine peptidase [Stieleria maiorica]QEF97271.1 Thermophilic serine proteinase precursor [Stieleria maiorica]
MGTLLRRRKPRIDRRARCRRQRLEVLEARHLLDAALASETTLPDIDTPGFDSDSVLVRYHAGAANPSSHPITEFSSVPGLRQVELPQGLDVDQSLEFYRHHPGVLYAEPNHEIRLSAIPNDPDFDRLWGLHNTGQTGGIAGVDIDATEAWDVTTGDASTVVAVIDTGVDYLHPDLAANMWSNPGEIPGDGIDNDGNGFVDDVHGYDFVSGGGDPMDDHNHGTHVAGTIGAVADNGIGVAGVSWNVQIMAVKFLSASGSGSIAAAVSAIEYAVDNGATLSNHSWGFNGTASQALADAIEYARLADHVVIAAAGNGGADQVGDNNDSRPFYPANFPHDNLIAVAATDHEDALATFSNYGATQVDVGAPGVGIYSTTRNNTYSTFNGTSMATPHVAGTVALLRSQHRGWSYEKIRNRLLDTVDPIAALDSRTTTGGRLNAATAVAPDENGPAVITQVPSGDVMKAQDRIKVRFDERIETGTFTPQDIVAFHGPLGEIAVTTVTPIAGSAGRGFEITFPAQTALGDYTMTFGPAIADPFGNPMDQNDNGINGESSADRFDATFTIVPDTVGPSVVAASPDDAVDVPVSHVRITFDEPIAAASFTTDRISDFVGPAGPIGVSGIVAVSPTEFDIVFPTQDVLGTYLLTVGGAITDPAGNLIDQDRDGIGGEADDDRYEIQFSLQKWLYADEVIDFSSQYTTTAWSAAQSLGPPDTFSYGDLQTAWAPRSENGTEEFLTVGFAEPLLASGVVIRETFGNGFVRTIEARNATTGEFVTVAQPQDTSVPDVPFDFLVTWPQTEYGVDAIRITIDTDHNLDAYEEIDAVQLRGVTVPDTDGARILESSLQGGVNGPVDRVELTFDEPILDGTFTLQDVLSFDGPDGAIQATAVHRLTSTRYEIQFPSQNAFGDYSLLIGPDLLDLDGRPMNQDQDDIDGEPVDDSYRVQFTVELWQFADSLIDFSSQYSPTSWSAEQALGQSDTFVYGDSRQAWAPRKANGTSESLTVGFATPVQASGVIIRETFGNGFVRAVHVRDADTGMLHLVSDAPDDSQPGTPVDHNVSWPTTSYLVDAVRITIDTDHSLSFEEIDSVRLRGVVPPDVTGPRVVAWSPDTGHPGPVDHVEVTFNEPIDAQSFTVDDLVAFDGPDGPIAIEAVETLTPTVYRIGFASQTMWGTYSMLLGPDVLDLAGNAMDQNGDGISGDPSADAAEISFDLELWQDASSVVDFSSQYSATSWSAAQTLGPPDTFAYADSRTAWAPRSANGTTEYLTVAFQTPVRSTGAIIRETYGNGFVRTVEARDAETGAFHVVSTDVDDSQPGTPVDYVVSWPMTAYDVDALRITVDTSHSFTFEEIDSVRLRGVVAPDTTGPRVIATDPDTTHSGPIAHVDVTFNEPIDPASFTADDVVAFTGPGGAISVDNVVQLAEDSYRIHFATQTEFGVYAYTIGPEIDDVAGNLMDQNANGIGGEVSDDRYSSSFVVELWQYASTVIDYSSQYSAFGWSAADALGQPDTFAYGDARTAWAPRYANSGDQSLTLGFDTPVHASGVVIRETFGNGFVRTVEVRDSVSGQFHVMPIGPDPSQPGTPVDYEVAWPLTSFTVDAVRITIDTTHSSGYEEIDAVRLRGVR